MARQRSEPQATPGGPEAPAAEEAPVQEERNVQIDADTPSGAALLEVGEPAEDASDEEKVEHAARYADVKRRHRWG